MSVISFLRDLTGLFNYSTDENPTTQQDYQAAVQNWVTTETSLVDTILWQPTTEYEAGNVVKTPSLASQYCLVCTTAGTSGDSEPDYTSVALGDTVTDGSVEWVVSQGAVNVGVETISPTFNSTNCPEQGTANCYYKVGNIVIGSFHAKVKGSVAYGQTIATGLPAPISQATFPASTGSAGLAMRFTINTSGEIIVDVANPSSSASWTSGSFVYVTSE